MITAWICGIVMWFICMMINFFCLLEIELKDRQLSKFRFVRILMVLGGPITWAIVLSIKLIEYMVLNMSGDIRRHLQAFWRN